MSSELLVLPKFAPSVIHSSEEHEIIVIFLIFDKTRSDWGRCAEYIVVHNSSKIFLNGDGDWVRGKLPFKNL